MNCKQGDLAYVVRGYRERRNLGRLVECIRYVGSVPEHEGDDLWLVDQLMVWSNGLSPYVPDHCLRPHRPGHLVETTDERKEVTA